MRTNIDSMVDPDYRGQGYLVNAIWLVWTWSKVSLLSLPPVILQPQEYVKAH